jgi:hypothetical protein
MPKGRGEMKDRLTDANSIVTLNNGETPTLAEYIAARGQGDSLTDFVATEADLVSLAYGIVDDLLAQEFLLQVCVSRRDIDRCHYTEFRLGRVWDFLPAFWANEMEERLRQGREKNHKGLQELSASQ